MGSTVFANTRGFSHKGSGDKSNSTVPDICKTPIGTATPPIPYAIKSNAADADGYSSSVFIDGNPTAIESSKHSKSAGDAAGKANGIISGSTKDITEFLTYSFDVKTEGEGTVRHADMTTMNKANTLGMVKGSSTSPATIPEDEQELYSPWVKFRMIYDNSWNTPFPVEKVTVIADGEKVIENLVMKPGGESSTYSYTANEASDSTNEAGAIIAELDPGVREIQVQFEKTEDVEKQISDIKKEIEKKLNDAYQDIVQKMKVFQRAWDTNPEYAVHLAAVDGALEGSLTWVKDQGALADPDTWSSAWDTISSFTSKTYDMAEDYAGEVYDEAKKNIDDALEALEKDPLQAIIDANQKLVDARDELLADGKEFLDDALEIIDQSSELAILLAKHQKEILEFPDYIATGDKIKIEYFVDNILMEIDADIANDLKSSENYYIILEIIEEHDTALIFSNYLGMTFDAVPPNFYAYLAGKYGIYIVLEVLLTIIISFFTAGAGGAAKVGALSVRILSGFKAAKSVKKLNNARDAIESLMKTVEAFTDSAKLLKKVGKLLPKRLEKKLIPLTKSQTKSKKKPSEDRKPRCKTCKKENHKKTKRKKGCIEYK